MNTKLPMSAKLLNETLKLYKEAGVEIPKLNAKTEEKIAFIESIKEEKGLPLILVNEETGEEETSFVTEEEFNEAHGLLVEEDERDESPTDQDDVKEKKEESKVEEVAKLPLEVFRGKKVVAIRDKVMSGVWYKEIELNDGTFDPIPEKDFDKITGKE